MAFGTCLATPKLSAISSRMCCKAFFSANKVDDTFTSLLFSTIKSQCIECQKKRGKKLWLLVPFSHYVCLKKQVTKKSSSRHKKNLNFLFDSSTKQHLPSTSCSNGTTLSTVISASRPRPKLPSSESRPMAFAGEAVTASMIWKNIKLYSKKFYGSAPSCSFCFAKCYVSK